MPNLAAAMALTAGIYSLLNAVYCIDGISDAVYFAAGRLSYLVGTVQCVLWLVYAYSDGNGSLRTLPRLIRWVAVSSLAAGLGFAATGWLEKAPISPITVAWAGVVYHYPQTTTVGDVYGLLLLVLPLVAVLRLALRLHQGERLLAWQVGLFAMVSLCGIEEVLVGNRVFTFPPLLDFGFVLLVVPISWQVIDRVVKDARKLRDLSDHLESEVVRRTAERDQVRTDLTNAEGEVSDLVASLDAIVWEADAPTLGVTFVSEGANRLLGYPADQWKRQAGSWHSHVHPDDRERVLASVREAVRSDRRVSLEYRMLAADGRIRWLRDYVRPVGSATASPDRLLGIIVDVTESRHAHDALLESEKRFRDVADTCPIMIWYGNPEGQITFLNKEAATFTGRDLGKLLGSGWVEHVHPDDLDHLSLTIASALREHHSFQVEFRLRRHDGEYRWVLDAAAPRFVGGAYAGHTGFVFDVTDLKRNQEQVLATQKFESLGVLASGIAHDFNNMLVPFWLRRNSRFRRFRPAHLSPGK